jgi:ATP-dependent protease ClpP protease subunit
LASRQRPRKASNRKSRAPSRSRVHNAIKAEAPNARAPGASGVGVINARANGAVLELDVFGPIGGWEGVTAQKFKQTLDEYGAGASEIVVNINSPGGDVFDGVSIHNLLVSHEANVTTKVYGLAASAASVIAIAGDEVLMGEGSFIMIHNAWSVAMGDTREMAKMSRTLSAIDKELAASYASHTGADTDAIKDMMDAETWISANEAIEQGFADGIFKADSDAQNSYDLSAFRNVPKALLKKGPKRSAKASKSAALPTPQTENLSPVLAALERLKSTINS